MTMLVDGYRTGVLVGREYLRSVDRWGRQRSTTDQHDENVSDARDQGHSLGEPYRDDDRSASRYARKVRDDFERMIADLEAGRFGADFLQLWESSRGSRRMEDWVRLLGLLETRGVLVRVTTHRRMYDPRNSRDRRSLLEDAVDSEYESSRPLRPAATRRLASTSIGWVCPVSGVAAMTIRPERAIPTFSRRRTGPPLLSTG